MPLTGTRNLLYDSRNDYSSLSLRSETFVLAPWLLYLDRENLATNGYYFSGIKSKIKCYLCGIIIDINDKDSISKIESLHFDKCRYYHKFIEDDDSEDEIDGVYNNDDDYDDEDTPDGPDKKELAKNLQEVKEENNNLTKFFQCRRCKDNKIQTLFLPCRHLVTCETCAESLDFCIHCQEKILGTVKTFIP